MRRALVLGGSGAVGGEVVRALVGAGVPTRFTWFSNEARAHQIADETGARPHRIDLTDGEAIRALVSEIGGAEVLVHCAASGRAGPPTGSAAELGDEDWDCALAVSARAAWIACRALAPWFRAAGGGDVVLLGAVDRAQSLPVPPLLAASGGALSALAMALAKELGRDGARVNLVALGPLDAGMVRLLDGARLDDFRRFSALRRTGTAAEAARVAVWLATENRYMTGRVVAVNGGI